MVSAGELVYGKRRALPAHPVHAHPSSRSSHKPSDVVRPTETRCRFCAGRMSSYEVGEAVAISAVLDLVLYLGTVTPVIERNPACPYGPFLGLEG